MRGIKGCNYRRANQTPTARIRLLRAVRLSPCLAAPCSGRRSPKVGPLPSITCSSGRSALVAPPRSNHRSRLLSQPDLDAAATTAPPGASIIAGSRRRHCNCATKGRAAYSAASNIREPPGNPSARDAGKRAEGDWMKKRKWRNTKGCFYQE